MSRTSLKTEECKNVPVEIYIPLTFSINAFSTYKVATGSNPGLSSCIKSSKNSERPWKLRVSA